jgi:hypothetical protein
VEGAFRKKGTFFATTSAYRKRVLLVHAVVCHVPLEKGVLDIWKVPLEKGVPSLLLSITRGAYRKRVLVVHQTGVFEMLGIGSTFRKRGIFIKHLRDAQFHLWHWDIEPGKGSGLGLGFVFLLSRRKAQL